MPLIGHSESVMAMLGRVAGVEQPQPSRWEAPLAVGPTLRKVRDPQADVEDTLKEVWDEPDPRRRRAMGRADRTLQRQRDNMAVRGVDGDGLLGGRRCCFELAQEIDRNLHQLPIPSEHVCPGCGTTWAVEIAVREERPHGRW